MMTLDRSIETHLRKVCVRQAVADAFEKIYGDQPVFRESPARHDPGGQIVGILSFTGEIALSIMLRFPYGTAARLSTRFVGFEISFEGDDMGDILGEQLNLFAESLTVWMGSVGIRVEPAPPTVVRGKEISFLFPEECETLRMSFESAFGPFDLESVEGHPK